MKLIVILTDQMLFLKTSKYQQKLSVVHTA